MTPKQIITKIKGELPEDVDIGLSDIFLQYEKQNREFLERLIGTEYDCLRLFSHGDSRNMAVIENHLGIPWNKVYEMLEKKEVKKEKD